MATLAQPKPTPPPARGRRPLGFVEPRRQAARLHLLTYVVGNAAFWVSWAAIAVSAERWYWWAIVPLAGWTLGLGLHLGHAYRRGWAPRLGRRG